MRILKADENPRLRLNRVFIDLLSNSPRCSTGYEGKENMFYSLNEQHYFTT